MHKEEKRSFNCTVIKIGKLAKVITTKKFLFRDKQVQLEPGRQTAYLASSQSVSQSDSQTLCCDDGGNLEQFHLSTTSTYGIGTTINSSPYILSSLSFNGSNSQILLRLVFSPSSYWLASEYA